MRGIHELRNAIVWFVGVRGAGLVSPAHAAQAGDVQGGQAAAHVKIAHRHAGEKQMLRGLSMRAGTTVQATITYKIVTHVSGKFKTARAPRPRSSSASEPDE